MGKNGPGFLLSARISLESTYFDCKSLLKMAKLSTSFCCLLFDVSGRLKAGPESLLNEFVSIILTEFIGW